GRDGEGGKTQALRGKPAMHQEILEKRHDPHKRTPPRRNPGRDGSTTPSSSFFCNKSVMARGATVGNDKDDERSLTEGSRGLRCGAQLRPTRPRAANRATLRPGPPARPMTSAHVHACHQLRARRQGL